MACKISTNKKLIPWEISYKVLDEQYPHLFKKKVKRSVITKEAEEYVNDVLFEHIESMEERFPLGGDNNSKEE